MTKKRTAAIALAAKGFKVFPIQAGAKFPPLIKDWPTLATCDETTVASWWTQYPEANIGIHTAGLLVVDVDPKKGGDESFKQLEKEHGLPETLTTITPTGGRHLFLRLPEGEAVANSVERLGKGLDVRSANGYVVGPGSTVPAGRYRFAGDSAVASAPASLVETARPAPSESRTHTEPVPDAPEEVVVRAIEYLRGAERSVRGQGGDQAAYRVACSLRDLGLSEQQAAELMRSEAWDYGCGWREGRLEDKPVRSAYRYAQNDAGSVLAAAGDFPIIPESGTIKPKSTGKAQRLSDYAGQQAKRPGYIVKGLLYRKSYVNLFGAPGEGKTFIALDIAYHVAAGTDWMARKVRSGAVVYLPFEGRGGLVTRAQALQQRYGQRDIPFYIADAVYNLRQKEGRQAFGALLGELPEKPSLIVIDTFAHALMGGDENSAQDVGAFNNAVAALIESTGACVMIVHHTGKNKNAGARGSSALLGAIDTEILVDGGAVTATKQRDVEAGEPIGFRLKTVVVGLDEDNEEVTSCVVEPNAATRQAGGKLNGNQKRAFDVLCDLRPNNDPITATEWKEKCNEFLPARKAAFYDLRNGLLRKGYISVDDEGMITRRCE